MKKLVWVAGLLLLLSFVFPNGLSSLPVPVQPAPVEPAKPAGPTDPKIVELLANADAEDLSRISGIYRAMITILNREGVGAMINTTEKWALYQANTLQLAVDTPGKYPGLDEAIEGVFLRTVGTDDVLPGNPDTRQKLIAACELISNSAETVK
jgi:hypothetical protein